MSKQAIVGLFTLFGLVALFAVCLFLANIGTGGRYQTAVHFKSAAGLHKGALVYESGVIVGVVDQTRLLPEDFTVDIVMAINNGVDIPRDSRFLIAAPLTGDATVEIVPPAAAPRPAGLVGPTPVPQTVALLPRQVLPIEQQPQGTNPATIGDLLEQGQGEVHRLDRMLAQLEVSEPKLLSTLQSALSNANDLTSQGSKRLYRLADRLDALTLTLQVAMEAGGKNLVDMTSQLDGTVRRNSSNVDTMLSMLSKSSVALNATIDQVRDLASNPQVHQNLLDTTKGLAQTATTIGQMTQDLRSVTGNPQTQAQLRDTIANTDAATQKLNSLLRSLGATSSVYGIDPGATPAPAGGAAGSSTARAAGAAGALGGGVSGGTIAGVPNAAASPTVATTPENFKSRIGAVARNLIAIQVRLSELDAYQPNSISQPLLRTSQRGPQSDVNAFILPSGKTSLFLGANDIGTPQTSWNLAVKENIAPHLYFGGGVLYSSLGAMVQYNPGVLGFEARLYDPQFPTLDAYGNVNLTKGVQLFGGERDITHNGRRTVFGLQLQF
jgi:ABC-type transporter Mla subunit MlaD